MTIGDEYSNWRAGSNVRASLMSTPRTRVVFPAAAAGPGPARSAARATSAAPTNTATAPVATTRAVARRCGRWTRRGDGRRERGEGGGGIVDLRVAASLGAGWRVSER